MPYEDWSIERLEQRIAELSAQKDALLAEASALQAILSDRSTMKELGVVESRQAQVLKPHGIESQESVMKRER